MSSYDTPDATDVFQEDFEITTPPIIPVSVEGVAQVQEMPCETFYHSWLLATGQADAEKILNADPRRKSVKLWWFGLGNGITGVCVSNNQNDARDGRGAFLVNGTFTSVTYDFDARNEIWVRPILITNSGGTFTAFTITTDDAFLNAEVEQWAR